MKIKKSIFALLFFVISTNSIFAANLNITCFKDYASFNTIDTKTQKIKINSDISDIFLVQDNDLVPYKIFGEDKKISIPFKVISVSSGNNTEEKYINDGNDSTFFSFDNLNDKNKSIVLDFGAKLAANDFETYFNINHNGPIIYSISDDNSVYNQVSEYNIPNFGFRYLKISLPNYKEDSTVNITQIREINFSKKSFSTILVNPIKIGKVNIYKGYDCNFESIKEDSSKYTILNQKSKFAIDSSTKEINVNFIANSSYNNDFDLDGIPNDKDNCKYVYNPDQGDIDGDGVGDKCDYDNTSKNPLDSDIDKDGVGDSVDNCKYIYNPDQKDSNGDGIGDACSDDDKDSIVGYMDNCPNVYNPDQKDINANNIGDACEFDKDKDGVFDSIDNCINTPNPDQADSDNDGIGDACDNCKLYNPDQKDENNNGIGDVCDEQIQYEKTHDSDGDGIMDSVDNCPKVANPLQEDLDKDGVGDACDNCLSIQNPDQKDEDKNGKGDVCEDVDKDGIDGYKDNCPYITNPDQKDSNNDGIGDVCSDTDGDGIMNSKDNCPYVYNPDQNDVDRDGIGDACDKKDNRYVESNKNFFVGMLISIVAIFGIAIYAMVRKLRGN